MIKIFHNLLKKVYYFALLKNNYNSLSFARQIHFLIRIYLVSRTRVVIFKECVGQIVKINGPIYIMDSMEAIFSNESNGF